MADFDDDLLALAGDESEGEQEEEQLSEHPSELDSSKSQSPAPAPAPAHSPTPNNSNSTSNSHSNSNPNSNSTSTSTEDKSPKNSSHRTAHSKAMSKGIAKRRKGDDSEEEGEASSVPSSPMSQGSAAMDESDSDTSPGEAKDVADGDTLYPLEGKFRDAKDKAKIMSMTQLMREEILADREEEQAGKKRDLQLRSLLESKDREAEKSQRKRKAAAANLDDAQPKSIRPKTKRDEALESYKQTREQAREDNRRREHKQPSRRSRSNSSHRSSQRDASAESEEIYRRTDDRAPKVVDRPTDLAQVQRMRITRVNVAQVWSYPGFEKAMVGCFARILADLPGGGREYKLGRISAVVTGKPYLVTTDKFHPFFTDQYFVLTHGNAPKEFSFNHCSGSSVTETEFVKWTKAMADDGVPLPMQTECAKIIDNLQLLVAHRFTHDELNAKLAKQRKYSHLLDAIQMAERKVTKSNEQQEKIRIRNEKSRRQNAEDVRKALVTEKHRQRAAARARAAAKEKEKVEEEEKEKNRLAVPKNDMDGLFSEASDVSRTATPVQKVAAQPPTPPKKSGMPTFTIAPTEDDIIGDMDLGIDIDID